MNITFDRAWDLPENNSFVYADRRRCSKRELYVIVSKITTGDIWCDSSQMGSVRDFIQSDLPSQTVCVRKGIHRDRLAGRFGLHITLAVETGCRSGNTFHVYGEVKGYAWEPDMILMYDPGRWYTIDHKVSAATPENRIEVPAGVMPAATFGSPASMA